MGYLSLNLIVISDNPGSLTPDSKLLKKKFRDVRNPKGRYRGHPTTRFN